MACAIFPPIEARFVFPLVVLVTKNESVLVPDQALAHLPTNISASATEVVSLQVGVPDVENAARLKDGVRH